MIGESFTCLATIAAKFCLLHDYSNDRLIRIQTCGEQFNQFQQLNSCDNEQQLGC